MTPEVDLCFGVSWSQSSLPTPLCLTPLSPVTSLTCDSWILLSGTSTTKVPVVSPEMSQRDVTVGGRQARRETRQGGVGRRDGNQTRPRTTKGRCESQFDKRGPLNETERQRRMTLNWLDVSLQISRGNEKAGRFLRQVSGRRRHSRRYCCVYSDLLRCESLYSVRVFLFKACRVSIDLRFCVSTSVSYVSAQCPTPSPRTPLKPLSHMCQSQSSLCKNSRQSVVPLISIIIHNIRNFNDSFI